MKKEFHLSEIQMPSSNVFQLLYPESYSCELLLYSHSHSVVHLRLWREQDTKSILYLALESVEYLQCPTYRVGANFCASTLDELVEFTKQHQQLDWHLTNQLRGVLVNGSARKLLTVESNKGIIKFLTQIAVISSEPLL